MIFKYGGIDVNKIVLSNHVIVTLHLISWLKCTKNSDWNQYCKYRRKVCCDILKTNLFPFLLKIVGNFYFYNVTIDQKRKTCGENKMVEAIKSIWEKKMGFLKAAQCFHVPRTTLFLLIQKDEHSANRGSNH